MGSISELLQEMVRKAEKLDGKLRAMEVRERSRWRDVPQEDVRVGAAAMKRIMIIVKTLEGTTFEADVNPSDTVAAVKKCIENCLGADLYPSSLQMLVYKATILKDGTTLKENNVDDNSTVFLMLTKRKSSYSGGSIVSTPEIGAGQSEEEVTWKKINDNVVNDDFNLPGGDSTIILKVGEVNRVGKERLGNERSMENEGWGTPKNGDKDEVWCTETLIDGTQFDSNRDRETPCSFTLDQGQVIKRWDHDIKIMKSSENANFTIPDKFAFGELDSSLTITLNATLQLDVELLKWTIVKDIGMDGGIFRKIFIMGGKWGYPNNSDEVSVNYKAQLEDGRVVSKFQGVKFIIGKGFFCPAKNKAKKPMKKGENALSAVKQHYGFEERAKHALSAEGPTQTNAIPNINLQRVFWNMVPEVTNAKEVFELINIELRNDGSFNLMTIIRIIKDIIAGLGCPVAVLASDGVNIMRVGVGYCVARIVACSNRLVVIGEGDSWLSSRLQFDLGMMITQGDLKEKKPTIMSPNQSSDISQLALLIDRSLIKLVYSSSYENNPMGITVKAIVEELLGLTNMAWRCYQIPYGVDGDKNFQQVSDTNVGCRTNLVLGGLLKNCPNFIKLLQLPGDIWAICMLVGVIYSENKELDYWFTTPLDLREEHLGNFQFINAWGSFKQRENEALLVALQDLLSRIDKRFPILVEGILTRNKFEWESYACVDSIRKGTITEIYRMIRDKLKRSWQGDNVDKFKQMMLGIGDQKPRPYKRALFLVDNFGVDVIVGMLYLARELLQRNTEVFLVRNFLLALMNEYRVLELNKQNAMLKSMLLFFKYNDEMGEGYIYTAVSRLDYALKKRDLVHWLTTISVVKQMTLRFMLLSCEGMFHLLNYLWHCIFKASMHVIYAVLEVTLGLIIKMNYFLHQLFRPTKKNKSPCHP